jgi:hypothetical protein
MAVLPHDTVRGLDDAGEFGQPGAPEQYAVLLGPAGEPLVVDPVAVAQRLESMVTTSGEPLFPHVDARFVAEDERYIEWLRTAAWQTLPPGPDLAYELTQESLGDLPTGGVVEVAQAHARLIAHHEALLSEALAELASRPEYMKCSGQHEHDAAKVAASEVSLALSWTPAHADARVRDAVALVAGLPATLDALREGRIDAYQARVLCDETAPLDDQPDERAAVEQVALRAAEGKTGPALRAYIRREVLRRKPELAEQRRQQSRRSRRADKPVLECHGMGSMQLYGPIEDLAALFTALDAAARARRDVSAKAAAAAAVRPDADVPLEALRFDVLAATAWAALNAGHLGCCAQGCSSAAQRLGTRHGRKATVNVTVPFTTLLGIDDEPGVLHGYGLIHPAAARRIAAEGSWRRILTDPATGAVLDYGITRYAPAQHLAEHVITRDVTCRFPTCNWTAEACDLDHTVPFKSDGTGGGATSHANLGAFHDRHHYDKTHHGFGVRQPSPGEFVINTPAGLVYHVDPEIVGPVTGRHVDEPGSRPPPDDDQSKENDESIDDIDQPDDPPF